MYIITCICPVLSRNLRFLGIPRKLGCVELHKITVNADEGCFPWTSGSYIGLFGVGKLGHVAMFSPLNTLQIKDSLKRKNTLSYPPWVCTLHTHQNTALLCMRFLPNVSKTQVTVFCLQCHSSSNTVC